MWRAVVRLADPEARAFWQVDRMVLRSRLDADALVRLLAEDFRPLPLVSPWNAGSGFASNGKSPEAERTLTTIRGLDDPRFTDLRHAVETADGIVAECRDRGWGGTGSELWDKKRKADVVAVCRNRLPDDALAWIDAAVVTGQDDDGELTLAYNRLLGTGGNFGRQDLQSTYFQRVLSVLTDPRGRKNSEGWLYAALFGEEGTPYLRESVGQFDPGRAGGIQSSPGEKADDMGFANPWSFLLTIEGATLFAAAATRRQGARNTRAALPFVVQASGVGYGSSADGEKAMAEIWTPQWRRPSSLAEIEHLLGEGRAEWASGAARTGLDFARAAATLGVDRGIHRFTRSVVVERLGQNPLAVPVGVVEVRRRGGTTLLTGLDSWLGRLDRRASLPGSVRSGVRRVQEAMYRVACGGGPTALREVLVELGRLHRDVSRSGTLTRDHGPLTLSSPTDWWTHLRHPDPDEAGAAELRVAFALSSGQDPTVGEAGVSARMSWVPALRTALTPVRLSAASGRPEWSPGTASVPTVDAIAALAEAHRLRCLPGRVTDPATTAYVPAVRGVFGAFHLGWATRVDDVTKLATGGLDELLLGDYLYGLLLLGGHRRRPKDFAESVEGRRRRALPPGLALLLPFYGTDPLQVRFRERSPATGGSCCGPVRADRAATRGHVDRVTSDAISRLQAAGARDVIDPDTAAIGLDGDRLAAALLVPLSAATRRHALAAVAVVVDEDSPDPDGPDQHTTGEHALDQHDTDTDTDNGGSPA